MHHPCIIVQSLAAACLAACRAEAHSMGLGRPPSRPSSGETSRHDGRHDGPQAPATLGSISAGDRAAETCNVVRYLWLGAARRWVNRKCNVIRYKLPGAGVLMHDRTCNVIRYKWLGAEEEERAGPGLIARYGAQSMAGAEGDMGCSLPLSLPSSGEASRHDGRHDGPQAGSTGSPQALQAPATLGSISAV